MKFIFYSTYSRDLFLIKKFHGVALAVTFDQFDLTIGPATDVSITNNLELFERYTTKHGNLSLAFSHVLIDSLSFFFFRELLLVCETSSLQKRSATLRSQDMMHLLCQGGQPLQGATNID